MLFQRNLSGLATLVVALAVLACGSAAEGGAGIGGEVMEPASSYGGDVDMVYLWGGGCSQNLKSQLKYQVSLDTVDELNGLIKAVQKRVPGCEVEVWNPRVWDVGPDAIDGTCSDRGSVDDTLWRVMDSYSDDGTRRWLMRDPSGEDRAAGVRLESPGSSICGGGHRNGCRSCESTVQSRFGPAGTCSGGRWRPHPNPRGLLNRSHL